MRIISQSGMIDAPYEQVCVSRNFKKPEEIIVWHPLETGEGYMTFATYSTKEKAVRAMKMLHEEYRKIREYETDYMGFAFDPPKVFQFPQDSEV